MDLFYPNKAIKKMLFEPIVHLGANKLYILSRAVTSSMASWLLTNYDEREIVGISINLIATDVMDEGITEGEHIGFKQLHNNKNLKNSFLCSYLYKQFSCEDNLLIWLKNDLPVIAFATSYNFTQKSLLGSKEEFINEIDAISAYNIYDQADKCSIFCNHSEVEEYITIFLPHSRQISISDGLTKCVKLPLVVKNTGEPGKRSGLNWGQRDNRNKNEAYIPLPRNIAKTGFFPLNKQHFLVITDDGKSLQLRVEQEGDKAITTPSSNALLGEYFRGRLDLSNGAYITGDDLRKYGREDVVFYKIDDEQFYMDFAPHAT